MRAGVVIRTLEDRLGGRCFRDQVLCPRSLPGVPTEEEHPDGCMSSQPAVAYLVGGVAARKEGPGSIEVTDVLHGFAQIDEDPESLGRPIFEQRRGSLRGSMLRSCRRAQTRDDPQPRGGASVGSDLTAVVVERAEFRQVTVRLLEVVAEDLLVLGAASRSRLMPRPTRRTARGASPVRA